MSLVTEKQNLLTILSEVIAECDRPALAKIVNFVAEVTWPSLRKQLVKSLIEADLHIDERYQDLATVCREELRQAHKDEAKRREDERVRQEKRAETSAKQSASAKRRSEIEAEVKATTATTPPAQAARPAEPPRSASQATQQQPITPTSARDQAYR